MLLSKIIIKTRKYYNVNIKYYKSKAMETAIDEHDDQDDQEQFETQKQEETG
jgi:hypothetical protein